jgi:hypothetical protein
VVKKFLDERQVPYILRNVAEDVDAALEFKRLGGRLPPLLLIGGQRVEGFLPASIEKALEALIPPDDEVSGAW